MHEQWSGIVVTDSQSLLDTLAGKTMFEDHRNIPLNLDLNRVVLDVKIQMSKTRLWRGGGHGRNGFGNTQLIQSTLNPIRHSKKAKLDIRELKRMVRRLQDKTTRSPRQLWNNLVTLCAMIF